MPSRGYLWNLTEWMERLGFNRDDSPNIAWGVQPTISLGDASALTSPILPPLAWFGDTVFGGLPGENFTFVVRSLAPGGSFVRELAFSSNATADFAFEFNTTPVALNNEVVLTGRNMGPEPVTAVVRAGSQTGNLLTSDDVPIFRTTASVTLTLRDAIYLPPGTELILQFSQSDVTTRASALVQDVPAMIPASDG